MKVYVPFGCRHTNSPFMSIYAKDAGTPLFHLGNVINNLVLYTSSPTGTTWPKTGIDNIFHQYIIQHCCTHYSSIWWWCVIQYIENECEMERGREEQPKFIYLVWMICYRLLLHDLLHYDTRSRFHSIDKPRVSYRCIECVWLRLVLSAALPLNLICRTWFYCVLYMRRGSLLAEYFSCLCS